VLLVVMSKIKKHDVVVGVGRELVGMDEIRALNSSLMGFNYMNDLSSDKVYPVNLDAYAAQSGIDVAHAFAEVKAILDKFLVKVYTVKLAPGRSFVGTVLAGYEKDENYYTLRVQWNSLLIPYLSGELNPGEFITIDSKMGNISSEKRYKLYEYLSKNLMYRGKLVVEYQEVRDVLQVEPHQYREFKDLNKRLIQPTLDDIWKELHIRITTSCSRGRITFITKKAAVPA